MKKNVKIKILFYCICTSFNNKSALLISIKVARQVCVNNISIYRDCIDGQENGCAMKNVCVTLKQRRWIASADISFTFFFWKKSKSTY